jgi:hypothetical protein
MALPDNLADFLLFKPLRDDPVLPRYVSHHVVREPAPGGNWRYVLMELSDVLRHAAIIVLQSSPERVQA